MTSAYKWGLARGACAEALEWLRSLGPAATQADAWRLCQRGDWMLWGWEQLPAATQRRTMPAIRAALDGIVARAIRRGQRAIRGVRAPLATQWRRWARGWLDGSDRSSASAAAASRAAWVAEVAARATEAAARAADWADRSAEAASWATWAAEAAARDAELRQQADDIRAELPEWPGGGCREG